MFGKKKAEKNFEPVDMGSGIDLLQEQIDAAKRLLDNRPVSSEDLGSWNDTTHEYLVKIYGEGSPNIDTIIRASGGAPAWIFMPDDVAEDYEAARLEDKMQKLAECVVALKRKASKTQIS